MPKKNRKKKNYKKKTTNRNNNYKKKSNTSYKKGYTPKKQSIASKKKIIKKKRIKIKKSFIFLIVGIIVFGFVSFKIVSKIINEKNISKSLSIILNGDKDISIEYGKEYKDQGAKASYKNIDLTDKIVISNNLNLKKLGKYYYKYTITYEGKTKKTERKITVKDTTKPVIKLKGDSTITIYTGSKYSEKGVSATDNYDGDITKKVTTSGSVNNKKVGTYKITYKVKDSSGNESSITRKVVVKNKPTNNTKTTESNSNSTSKVGTSSKGYKIEKKNGLYYVGGILVVNKTYDLPSTYNPGGLLSIFTTHFNKMKADAKKEGITLSVISGFRSYSYQKTIYNKYVNRDGKAEADRYSARPGHSEHQTGLAADINKISYTWHTTKEGKWVYDNCYKYGFVIRYTQDGESKTGYKFEPWHIRYLGVDIATKLYNGGNWITLEEYLGITSKYD